MKATGSTSNGNRKRARRMKPATMMTRSSSRMPMRKPSNSPSSLEVVEDADEVFERARGHRERDERDEREQPAATRSPASSKPTATTARTANTSSDQPKKPPSECSDASHESSATIAKRMTNMPAYMKERGARPARADGVHRRDLHDPVGRRGLLLPASGFEQLFGAQVGGGDADHRLAEPGGNAREHVGVAEVRRRLDDRLRA